MTLDERLDRLTERHEALTQSIELMIADNRQRDERVEALTQSIELMVAENRQRDERMGQVMERMGQVMEGIARLLHIAEIHEHRLDRLEQN